MKPIIEVSVDDEVANKFSYISESRLEIGFTGFFDLKANSYQDKSCSLIISQWTSAFVEVYNTTDKNKKYSLEQKLGIVSMILFIKIIDSTTKLDVVTLDNRYLRL